MGETTGIAWTGSTWNPVRGCAPVSPGCAHCYAARMASRFSGPGQPYEGLASGGRWTGAARFVPEMLDLPLRWRKPRRVFVNSMSDLFHDDITDAQIAAVFGVMAAAPQHTFQILTKRPARMVEWFRWIGRAVGTDATTGERVAVATDPFIGCEICAARHARIPPKQIDHPRAWPLHNVWIGVSAEDQARADERIPLLLQTPAAVRFVSCEPLLGEVRFVGPAGAGRIDWVIVGGESGPRARPCSVSWVRSIVWQCRNAGVSVFVKQLGANPMMRRDSLEGRRAGDHPEREWPEGTRFGTSNGDRGTERQGLRVFLRDGHGGDMAEWPEDLRVREWPR